MAVVNKMDIDSNLMAAVMTNQETMKQTTSALQNFSSYSDYHHVNFSYSLIFHMNFIDVSKTICKLLYCTNL